MNSNNGYFLLSDLVAKVGSSAWEPVVVLWPGVVTLPEGGNVVSGKSKLELITNLLLVVRYCCGSKDGLWWNGMKDEMVVDYRWICVFDFVWGMA